MQFISIKTITWLNAYIMSTILDGVNFSSNEWLLCLIIDMETCGSWIYNYLCNQYLSPLTQLMRGVLDTTLCDKVCQWLVADRWFSPVPPVSSTNKTDRHDITEMLLKVALNTRNPNQTNQKVTMLQLRGLRMTSLFLASGTRFDIMW